MKATNIMWDIDNEESIIDELVLPSEVDIPNGIDEENVADYLSDIYGFCVFEFNIEQ